MKNPDHLNHELEQIQQLLQAVRTAVEPLSRDRRLSQWQRVNFDRHDLLFKEYGLRDNYKQARNQLVVGIRTILHELARLENEYGDLAIDIRRRTIAPQAAKAAATNIQKQAELLEPPLRELEAACRVLFKGREQLFQLYSLAGLLPYAKKSSRVEPEELDQGLRFFLFVTRQDAAAGTPSLAHCLARATALEQQLKALEFADLPPLAGNLLEQHRLAGLTAADRLKAYIEQFRRRPPQEIKTLEEFRNQLKELRRGETVTLLTELPRLSARYGTILFDLAYRARNQRQIALIQPFLDKLELLHSTLAGPLPALTKEQLATPDSSLNPEQLAAAKAADFFMGLRGVMLSFKLLLRSLSGQKAITALELQRKTVDTLKRCPSHHTRTEEERTRLELILHEALTDYSKPFPFDLLATHLRKCILTFGRRLERLVNQFPIGRQPGNGDSGGDDHTLGLLTAKLEIWGERLEN
ncbi:hypothetical protein [Desulfurivibrio alkaliphilus]|uniref:Uncharacterized protein n=1 Tax=Desulfurivibrio alkaliphilus (strain DSM 19089 / UNIQEM U267 / AHT2) TaxID=589865 RepID=D6Z3C8_DESAT|nr:hypothetical protein [Desulfurivibrio alkaliphilus]ADH86053.1 hypothetical protein DaAHT2_1358 [Desulfurivibrio alkaliphilus AHT 2]